jgi:hypothetical protein
MKKYIRPALGLLVALVGCGGESPLGHDPDTPITLNLVIDWDKAREPNFSATWAVWTPAPFGESPINRVTGAFDSTGVVQIRYTAQCYGDDMPRVAVVGNYEGSGQACRGRFEFTCTETEQYLVPITDDTILVDGCDPPGS